jgi:hypothetical protein
MITPRCSKCKTVIPSDDVNVANDLAFCRACDLSFKLSELTYGSELTADLDVHHPPQGAWYHSDGAGTVIGASHRSVGAALGTLAIALFWNGIVSVFVLIVTASTLRHFGMSLPEWFPAPKMNGGDMGVGMTIFMWIFLTPFIAVGMALALAFLSALGGRTEVQINNAQSMVFVGIGALGYRRRFDASSVKDVRIDDKVWRDSDGDRQRKTNIVIETREGKLIKFGSMLREDRRKFMAGAVRNAVVR